MADEAHSLFSASGSDAWGGPCPGKPAMEHGRKTSSVYADKGTAGHTLASWVLSRRIAGETVTAQAYLGRKIEVENGGGKRVFTVDSEMADHIDEYVDGFLEDIPPGSELFCEQRVYYHEHLGVAKDLAWGTMDAGAILWDQPELEWEGRAFPAGDELRGEDLKMGHGVLVTADTMQLRLYLAGLYQDFGHLGDFTRVRMVIRQPPKGHVDEVVLTVDELLAEVATLRANVPRVIEAWDWAAKDRAAGASDEAVAGRLYALGLLGPSEKGCRFCDARGICPALTEAATEAFSGRRALPDDFEDLTVDTPEEVRTSGNNYLSMAFDMLPLVEIWTSGVRAEIDRRVLLKGETFPNIKVVPGKKGRRTYTEAGEVELLVKSWPKPLQELVYARKLKTPTQALAALKTSPLFRTKLAALVHQPEGRPSVVHLSDKRAAMSHRAVIDDFENLTQQPGEDTGAEPGYERHPFR